MPATNKYEAAHNQNDLLSATAAYFDPFGVFVDKIFRSYGLSFLL
jgi:hypothetical protein